MTETPEGPGPGDAPVAAPAKDQKPASSERARFTRTERIFGLIALLILAVLSYSYVTGIPLSELLRFGEEEDKLSVPIGTATVVEGQVLRKRAKEASFRPLTVQSSIFPNDTVMTGPDGLCVIVFKNGRTIRITANSLIKLTYGSNLSKDGIIIDVLRGSYDDDAGKVVPLQGKPAPPVGMPGPAEPKPIPPMAIVSLSPTGTSPFHFTNDEFASRRKPIPVSVRLNRPGHLTFVLTYIEPVTKNRVQVASASPKFTDDVDAALTFEFDHPGSYDWEILDENGARIGTHRIVLAPSVQAIQPLPAYDASDRLEGEATEQDFKGPLLRWTPIAGAGAYRVHVGLEPKTMTTREALSAELRVSPSDAPVDRPLHYWVEKEAPGGFRVTSGPQTLVFELEPPSPTAPRESARYHPSSLTSRDQLVLFGWSKTNFTAAYEFQLATSETFSTPLLTKTSRENFMSLRTPAPGLYYWRVRSKVQGVWTPYSQVRSFTVDSSN